MHLAEETSIAAARMTGLAGVVQKAERLLGTGVAAIAALLVVAEIVVLFTGVSARYFFQKPIIWSDELAGILFLWLAMLGAVVAFQRGEHMRMTAIVGQVDARKRAFFDVLAIAAPLAFLILVIQPAVEFASDEAFVSTPALDISSLWRAAALPVGLGLMLAVAVLRLLSCGNLRLAASAVGIVAVTSAALYALSPLLIPLGNLNLLIFFVVLVAIMVFAAVPIAFAFGLATFAYITLTTSTPATVVIGRMDEGMSHLILLSVPLFVFLGLLIEMTGMARAMVNFLASLLGHVRGGLQYVLVAAMYLVSGISGAKAVDMAAVAPVLFPEMTRRGAKPGDLVALLSATGAQTETIPPSLVLITIGSVTGVSIAALFTGGLLPALVLAVMLCAVVWRRYTKDDLSHVKPASWGEVGRTFLVALPAIALDPRSRSRRRCDRNRGVDDRHRLFRDCRPPDLPEIRLAAALSDADRNRRSLRRHPPYHWRRDRHGLGADPVGFLDVAGRIHDRPAGRCTDVPGRDDPGLHRSWQRAGGHSRDRAVRAVVVSDRQASRGA